MRVTNLILHIIAFILMLPCQLFVGINAFMGLAYSRGMDFYIILAVAAVFGTEFLASSLGEIYVFAKYKSTRPVVYMRRELIIHGLAALCFAAANIYMIIVALNSSAHDYGIVPALNLAGFVVSLAGIVITAVCSRYQQKHGSSK